MSGNTIIRLVRDDWTVEVPAPMWAQMLLFLSKCDWKASVPGHWMLANGHVVSPIDAQSLAAAGEVILDETARNPPAALQSMHFDWGKFAEIVTFAAKGSFTIKIPAR